MKQSLNVGLSRWSHDLKARSGSGTGFLVWCDSARMAFQPFVSGAEGRGYFERIRVFDE
jgi:hypothetical protein